jgi:predicted enzyme related to lactoylglutathione lyase
VRARPVSVALRASDLAATARFYRESLGLPLEPAGGGALDERRFELAGPDGSGVAFVLFQGAPGEESQRVQVALEVDDLHGAHDRAVATGAAILHGPRDEPAGLTARFADPDGNVVALVQA